MEPLLDLQNEINLEVIRGLAVKDVIAGETAIVKRLEELGPDADGPEGEEFDALVDRLKVVRSFLDDHKRVERAAVLKSVQRSNQRDPLRIPARGIEARSEDPNDPYLRPHKRYSLQRAIALQIQGKPLDGYEGEVSREIAKRFGKDPQGFFMPLSLDQDVQRAEVTTTVGSSLIATRIDQTMIEKLQKNLAMAPFGVTILTDLKDGALQLPKRTANNTAYHVAESTDITDSNATFSSVTLTPKTLGASTFHSRKFLLQQSLVNESMLRGYLEQSLRLELDRVGVNGSGSGAVPTGILQNSTISAAAIAIGTDGGPLTFAKAVAMETLVAANDADIGNLGYLTNTKVRGSAKTILKASSAGSEMIWENNEINGYRAVASNQVPSTLTKGSSSGVCSAMIFGNFADAVYGFWSGVDVVVNPYALDKQGGVRITALIDYDFGILRTESFAVCLDLTT